MNKLIFNIITISVFFIYPSFAGNLDVFEGKSDYENQLINNFSGLNSYTVSYYVLDMRAKFLPEKVINDIRNNREMEIKLVDKLKSGEKTNIVLGKGVTLETLECSIKSSGNLLEKGEFESIYTYSCLGNKVRLDVVNPDGYPEHHWYLFDGHTGFVVYPETEYYLTNNKFTKSWTDIIHIPLYGSGLHNMLNKSLRVAEMSEEENSVYFDNANMAPHGIAVKCKLLDNDPFYWNELSWSSKGKTIRKVICDDFVDYGAVKIPNFVLLQKLNGEELETEQVLDLIDVKLNDDCEFDSTFFDIPEGYEVQFSKQ